MSSQQGPSDWQTTRRLIKERGRYILEKGIWSDCSFVVGSEPQQQIFEGHKLILAMGSPVFEAMFYGGMAETRPIAILDVQPDAFKTLLEYIYTDQINLTSFDQACELCYGAKKYMLPHLVEKCTRYLWSDLSPKNAYRAYEFAKLFEEPVLMDKCLNLIRNNTREVLTESSYEDVHLNTLLTVFEQNELNIFSEMELFTALDKYVRCNKNSVSKVSRIDGAGGSQLEEDGERHPTLRDALMKIRFLTLNPQEFCEGPATSNLLNESEKFALLMNISSQSSTLPLPNGFSSSRTSRRKAYHTTGNTVVDTSRSSLIYFQNREASGSVEEGGNEFVKKLYCTRTSPGLIDCHNLTVLEASMTFSCDKNICMYGIQVPTQDSIENYPNFTYTELLYAHLLDSDGSRLTYTHFTSRVPFRSFIDICFNRPIKIQKNKTYKVDVALHKTGHYPLGSYESFSSCNGVTFCFIQGKLEDSVRDGLIRSIIFSYNPSNQNSSGGFNAFPIPGPA